VLPSILRATVIPPHCAHFCPHSWRQKERVGGSYYYIRRVLGRHLAWYWSRDARILARSSHARVRSLTRRGHAYRRASAPRRRGGGDCLENGDMDCTRLLSIANIYHGVSLPQKNAWSVDIRVIARLELVQCTSADAQFLSKWRDGRVYLLDT